MRKKAKKSSMQEIRPSLIEIRARFLSQLNQLGEDRDALLRLIKDFFIEAFSLKTQISFDDLPGILEHKRLDQQTKDQVLAFAEYLVDAQYSPSSKGLSTEQVEERFRRIVFLVTLHEEEDGKSPVRRLTARYASPLKRLYRHFVLPPEEQADLKRYLELQKRCMAFARAKDFPKAKLEYNAILRRYRRLSPGAAAKAYPKLEEAHRAVLRCLPHEAHLQKLLNRVPKRITKRNRAVWQRRYAAMVKHYRYLSEGQRSRYYARITEVRRRIREDVA